MRAQSQLARWRQLVLDQVREGEIGQDGCYEDDPSLEVTLSWNLRFAAALAVGSTIYGDTEYAGSAARVARHAAAQLFDQPDPLVLRGMLVLAFHCLSTNQQSRAACYLAVATRMCCLVDISPEIPVLGTFMEDMRTKDRAQSPDRSLARWPAGALAVVLGASGPRSSCSCVCAPALVSLCACCSVLHQLVVHVSAFERRTVLSKKTIEDNGNECRMYAACLAHTGNGGENTMANERVLVHIDKYESTHACV